MDIFIMSHSKFRIVSSIRLQGGKRTQTMVSIWGQLEFCAILGWRFLCHAGVFRMFTSLE